MNKLNVLWALSPVDFDPRVLDQMKKIFLSLPGVVLYPCYVASACDFCVAGSVSEKSVVAVQKSALSAMETFLGELLEHPSVMRPQVLCCGQISVQASVDKQKCLFATDLSHESLLNFIKFSYLSKSLGYEIAFVNKAYSDDQVYSEKRLKQFSDLAQKCGLKTSLERVSGANPSVDEIAAYAYDNNFGLLGISCSVSNSV